jgi:hypothetical protein
LSLTESKPLPPRREKELIPLEAPGGFDSSLKLDIARFGLIPPYPSVRNYAPAFEQFATPGVPCSGRNPRVIAVGDLVNATANQAARGALADYRGELDVLVPAGHSNRSAPFLDNQ